MTTAGAMQALCQRTHSRLDSPRPYFNANAVSLLQFHGNESRAFGNEMHIAHIIFYPFLYFTFVIYPINYGYKVMVGSRGIFTSEYFLCVVEMQIIICRLALVFML